MTVTDITSDTNIVISDIMQIFALSSQPKSNATRAKICSNIHCVLIKTSVSLKPSVTAAAISGPVAATKVST